MSTGVTLLVCAFLLYCTGSGRVFSGRIRVAEGKIAASCLLFAAASGFSVSIGSVVSCNVSSVLLVLTGFLLCRKLPDIFVTILLAFLCGILGWFLLRLFPTFLEPALPLALPAVLLSQFLPGGEQQRLLCVTLSPLFFGLTAALEDWYLFDKIFISFGNTLQFNTQILGLVLLAVVSGLPERASKKVFDVQKV